MTPELARAALEFLKRTELRGVETYVMHALLQELERDANAKPAAPPLHIAGGAAVVAPNRSADAG